MGVPGSASTSQCLFHTLRCILMFLPLPGGADPPPPHTTPHYPLVLVPGPGTPCTQRHGQPHVRSGQPQSPRQRFLPEWTTGSIDKEKSVKQNKCFRSEKDCTPATFTLSTCCAPWENSHYPQGSACCHFWLCTQRVRAASGHRIGSSSSGVLEHVHSPSKENLIHISVSPFPFVFSHPQSSSAFQQMPTGMKAGNWRTTISCPKFWFTSCVSLCCRTL